MRVDPSIKWVPVAVAAEELGITRQAVRGLIMRGRLAAQWAGGQRLVSVLSIEARLVAQEGRAN